MAKHDDTPPWAEAEVFVISGGREGRQPLENEEIKLRRLADQAGQYRMDLSAVVGLVIEPVRQRRGHLLLELLRRGDAAISDRAGDARHRAGRQNR